MKRVANQGDIVFKGSLLLACIVLLLNLPLSRYTILLSGERTQGEIHESPIDVEVVGPPGVEGIYELPDGTTVGAFLDSLGARVENKDARRGLLDQPLKDFSVVCIEDGSRLEVVRVSTMSPGKQFLLGGRLDLNRAGVRDLMLLPGIGSVLARRIVDYRRSSGPYRSSQELVNVTGISTKTVRKIESMVTTSSWIGDDR
jgi:competence protein ComEA